MNSLNSYKRQYFVKQIVFAFMMEVSDIFRQELAGTVKPYRYLIAGKQKKQLCLLKLTGF